MISFDFKLKNIFIHFSRFDTIHTPGRRFRESEDLCGECRVTRITTAAEIPPA